MANKYMVFTDSGESIGCSMTKEKAESFISWLLEDLSRIDEFMPDSDPNKVKYLCIKDAI